MGQAPLLCTHESGNQIKLHGCMCQSCVSGLINRNKKYWRPVVCLLLWGGHYPVTQHAVTYLVLTPTHSYTHCKGGGGKMETRKKTCPKSYKRQVAKQEFVLGHSRAEHHHFSLYYASLGWPCLCFLTPCLIRWLTYICG